jgi:hypothetical protein
MQADQKKPAESGGITAISVPELGELIENAQVELDSENIQQVLNSDQTDDQQTPTNQKPETSNDKPETNQKHTHILTHESMTIPVDFELTPERRDKAFEFWCDHWCSKFPPLDPEEVFERFVNHYLANPIESCSWDAMWGNWYMDKKTLDRG